MSKERIEYLSEVKTTTETKLENIPEKRFPKGTWYKTKLRESLKETGLLHLENDCLLSTDVQMQHAKLLHKKAKSKYKNIQAFHKIDAEYKRNNFRMITILDSIAPLDHEWAIDKVDEFRKELVKFFKKYRSLWAIGAIEVEIVNIKYMRAAKAFAGDNELRKLDLCEKLLARDVGRIYEDGDSYALIHFHGLVYLGSDKAEEKFEDIKDDLKKFKRWSDAQRQVELKKLSETWDGKPRTLRENVEYLCNYITKGGVDRLRGDVYMRYKFNYEHLGRGNDETDDHVDIQNTVITNELGLSKRIDNMSWSNKEIAFMAKLTHSMMYEIGMKKDKKSGIGHLISLFNRRSRNKLV